MFKIGDRVRYTPDAAIGEGTIVSPRDRDRFWVDFDKNHHTGYSADGKGRMDHCYTVSIRQMEKVILSPLEEDVRKYIQSEFRE